jgi:hypothetical protein
MISRYPVGTAGSVQFGFVVGVGGPGGSEPQLFWYGLLSAIFSTKSGVVLVLLKLTGCAAGKLLTLTVGVLPTVTVGVLPTLTVPVTVGVLAMLTLGVLVIVAATWPAIVLVTLPETGMGVVLTTLTGVVFCGF